MDWRTLFLSRLLGLFTLIMALALIVRPAAGLALIDAVIHDQIALLMLGMMALAAGLAIVLTHNLWHGGALPVVVTILGWILVIRGLFLLFAPPATVASLIGAFHFDQYFLPWMAIPLALGAYLTLSGFRSNPH